MNLRYLEYFIVLAETGNMTRAAQKLYISQSNLSQYLSHEEKRIGKKLFQRVNGRYVPTPAGEIYIKYAKKMVELNQQFNQEISDILTSNVIRIGITSSPATRMLESIRGEFNILYPSTQFTIVDCSNLDNAVYSLSNGNLDIAFVAAHSENLYKGPSRILAKEEVVFGVPTSFPKCSAYQEVSFPKLTAQKLIQQFGRYPFILPYEGSCIRYLVDDFFQKFTFDYNTAYNAVSSFIIMDMIASGFGVGFVPINNITPTSQIKYFSLSPKLYRLHSVYLKNESLLIDSYSDLIKLAARYFKNSSKKS